jgi:hypothetical protein
MKEGIDRLLSDNSLLMAKDIAKALGITRKEVNSYLHSHQDNYEKDAEFRWRLIETQQITLTLPTGWVTGDTFEEILQEAGDILNGPYRRIDFVFSSRCKTMIDCIARMLALMNQMAHRGKLVTVNFADAGRTLTYLNRAGFFDLLASNVAVVPGRPSVSAAKRLQGKSDTLVEFGSVDPHAANDDIIEQLTNKFVQQSSTDYRVAALTVFGELIGNVFEHSGTPLAGFAGLQKYSGLRNHIQTVVSDSGVGIARTLRPALKTHYPSLYKQFGESSLESDMGLVAAAMSKGEISRFGGARGLGFKSSREQAVKFNAQFSVRQEQFCLKFEFREGQLISVTNKTGLSNLLGTHICFDFYLD